MYLISHLKAKKTSQNEKKRNVFNYQLCLEYNITKAIFFSPRKRALHRTPLHDFDISLEQINIQHNNLHEKKNLCYLRPIKCKNDKTQLYMHS